MLRENLKDAGEIIQNILTQPLSVQGATPNISLLTAAENFRISDAETSDLKKIILSFLTYREPTETMLRELSIIYEELKNQNDKKRLS